MPKFDLQYLVFLALLIAVSVAFGWILLPYYGAVFWAVVLAIIFSPLQHRLLARLSGRSNLSALLTLATSLVVAVLPVILIAALLVQEGTQLYRLIESGQIDLGSYLGRLRDFLPGFLRGPLDRSGLADWDNLRQRLSGGLLQASQMLAQQMFSFGQGTFQFLIGFFIMLYLLFFFIRDGAELVQRIKKVVPLSDTQKRRLFSKFTRVVRATVKGNIVVAATQGALGGIIFWLLDIPSALLWGVLMAFLSLLPAVGAGIIWVPVAMFFLVSGQLAQGLILTLYGIGVIGLVDNFLRPLLVGKDIKMPDYVVLVSTLGGLSLVGLNGFVIGPLVAALFISTWGLFAESTVQQERDRLAGEESDG